MQIAVICCQILLDISMHYLVNVSNFDGNVGYRYFTTLKTADTYATKMEKQGYITQIITL